MIFPVSSTKTDVQYGRQIILDIRLDHGFTDDDLPESLRNLSQNRMNKACRDTNYG